VEAEEGKGNKARRKKEGGREGRILEEKGLPRLHKSGFE